MQNTNPETILENDLAQQSKTWSPTFAASLVACITGCLIGGALIQAIDPLFKFAELPELGIAPKPELVKKHQDATVAFWTNNYAVDFGLLGLCLGSAIGLLSTRRQRILSGLAGGFSGLLSGAVAGFAIGIFVAKSVLLSTDQSMVQSTLYHFSLWASLAACVLLMVGFVQRGWRGAFEGAAMGMVLGLAVSVVYNLLSSVIFANSNLMMLLPSSTVERGFWLLICSSVLGFGLHFGLRAKHQKQLVSPQLPAN